MPELSPLRISPKKMFSPHLSKGSDALKLCNSCAVWK